MRAGKRRGITRLLAEFAIGGTVRIRINPAENAALPLRFNGRTAKVVAKQGKAYVVEIRDLNATKHLVLASGHLESVI